MKLVKILTLILFFLSYSSFIFSAPLKFVPVKLTQPDGSIISVFASGDEHYHWIHDKDNYTIVRHPATNYFVYAAVSGNKLIPTDYVVGKIEPKTTGLNPGVNVFPDVKQSVLYKPMNNAKVAAVSAVVGTRYNLVVFIRFSGEAEFTDPMTKYDDMFNNLSGKSLKDFYQRESFNKLDIVTSFYPHESNVVSYQDIYPRNYYQKYDASNNPTGYTPDECGKREWALLRRALDSIKDKIPSNTPLDGDGDGKVDNVTFIVYGNVAGWSELLWPHNWAFYDYIDYRINGKKVFTYDLQINNSIDYQVVAHEMGHSLGLPDLYRYTNTQISPLSSWDLMSANAPHINNYAKWKYLGWISTVPEISQDGTYYINKSLNDKKNIYKIKSHRSNEYFVLEYYKNEGSYKTTNLNSGLLVYRINENASGNSAGPPDEVYLYRPDGTLMVDGNCSKANYGSEYGRTGINDTSNPFDFLSDGLFGGLNVKNIGSVAADSIGFDVKITINSSAPVAKGATSVSKQSFAAEWNSLPGASGYTLDVAADYGFTSFLQGYNNKDVGSNTRYTVENLTAGTVYYYRVKGKTGDNQTPGSNIINVTTLPAEPVLNVSGICKEGFFITWNAVGSATGYYLDIAAGKDFNNILSSYSKKSISSSSTIEKVTGLSASTEYYLRLKAYNENGEGAYSSVINVCTNDKSVGATIALPALNVSQTQFLAIWYYSGYKKLLDVSANADFTTCVEGYSNKELSMNDRFATVAGLTPNTNYYYRLRITDSGVTSENSNVVSVTTLPNIPTALDPEPASVTQTGFTARWSIAGGAAGFYLDVSANPDFSTCVSSYNNKNVGSVTSYQITGLSPNTKYYYRVRAYNSSGITANSNNASTDLLVGIGGEEGNIIYSYNLQQNYPNPFNPGTVIRYTLKEACRTKITVYSITGAEVATLVDEYQSRGKHEVKFNANILASGIYLYKIQAGEFLNVKKMILLK